MTLYRCADVRGDRGLARDTNLRPRQRLPRAGRDGGHRPRSSRRSTSSRSRSTSIRSSCGGATTSTSTRRAGLPYSRAAAARLLRPRRRARRLGRARRACATPQADGCCAAWAARRRSGGAAAGRRRTPRCGIGAERRRDGRDGHPGHRHRHADGDADRRRRGARPAARARARDRAATPAPNVYGPIAGGSQTTPSVMPAVRGAAAEGARKLLLRSRATCSRSPSADLELRRRPDPLARRRARRAVHRGDGEARRRDDRRLAACAARTRTASRVHTFGCQIAQVAVDPGHRRGRASSGSSRCTTSAGSINPLGASSQVEGGVLQGMALRAHRRSASSTRRRASRSTRRSTTTSCRRSRTRREIVVEFVDVPDDDLLEHRREGARRAADRADGGGDRERVPRTRRAPRRGRCR